MTKFIYFNIFDLNKNISQRQQASVYVLNMKPVLQFQKREFLSSCITNTIPKMWQKTCCKKRDQTLYFVSILYMTWSGYSIHILLYKIYTALLRGSLRPKICCKKHKRRVLLKDQYHFPVLFKSLESVKKVIIYWYTSASDYKYKY